MKTKVFRLHSAILFVFSIFLLLSFSSCNSSPLSSVAPTAKQGVLDLSEWNTQSPVSLDGEWEFYWNQLLSPQDFESENLPHPDGWIEFPGVWKNYILNEKPLPAKGYATFRLKIKLPSSSSSSWGFYIPYMLLSYQMWGNDSLLSSNGQVGNTSENEVVKMRLHSATLHGVESTLNIIIQISNFADPGGGGIQESLQIGTPLQVQNIREQKIALNILLAGAIFVMGLYNFALFASRREERSPLFLGLFCLLLTLRLVGTRDSFIVEKISLLDSFSFYTESLIGGYIFFLFDLFLQRLFPEEFWIKVIYFVTVVTGVWTLITLIGGLHLTLFFAPWMRFYIAGVNIYILYTLVIAYKNKRNGSLLILLGSSILLGTLMFDIAWKLHLTYEGGFVQYGLFTFVLFNSLVLANRFSQDFLLSKQLSKKLMQSQESLEEIVNQRTHALKESEKRLQLALDNAALGIWENNFKTGESFFSLRYAEILGYDWTEIKGRPEIWEETLYPEDYERVMDAMSAYLNGDQHFYDIEYRIQSKTGNIKWLHIRGKVFERDANGLPIRILGTVQDITRSKYLKEHSIQAEKEASVDRFLTHISHELRTPLNGIIGLSETLLSGVLGKLSVEAQENLKIIIKSGRRLSHLIAGILDLAQTKKQELKLQIQSVSVFDIVNQTLKLAEGWKGEQKVHLHNYVPEQLSAAAADPARLQQILINLIDNALKYTTTGEIVVNARLIESDTPEILLSVSDTGVGIPEQDLERIFEEFEQGSNKVHSKGSGIGLSLVQNLVELHGGNIQVESILRQGTTFHFTLPCWNAENFSDSTAPDTKYSTKPHKEGANSGGWHIWSKNSTSLTTLSQEAEVRVLVVDDEIVNREVVKQMLRKPGYSTHEVAGGSEALSYLETHEVDLILLDLMMPEMSGYEVLKILRESYSFHELPVLVLTANHQTEALIQALKEGANDYLTKPFAHEELLARMENMLRLRRHEELNQELEHSQALEQELSLSRYRLLKVIDFAGIALIAITQSGSIRFCNQKATSLIQGGTQNGAEEWLGQSIESLFPELLTQLRPLFEQHSKQEIITHGEVFQDSTPDMSTLQFKTRLCLEETQTSVHLTASMFEFSEEFGAVLSLVSQQENSERSQNLSPEAVSALHTLSQWFGENPPRKDSILDSASPERLEQKSISKTEELREAVAQVMCLSVLLWKAGTQKNNAELAQESGLWTVSQDGSSARAITLQRYLNLKTLPRKPKWEIVLKTAEYVLEHVPGESFQCSELKQAVQRVRHALHS